MKKELALVAALDRRPGWFQLHRRALAVPCSVARLQLVLASRSLTDFPRELQIDATDGDGRTWAGRPIGWR